MDAAIRLYMDLADLAVIIGGATLAGFGIALLVMRVVGRK